MRQISALHMIKILVLLPLFFIILQTKQAQATMLYGVDESLYVTASTTITNTNNGVNQQTYSSGEVHSKSIGDFLNVTGSSQVPYVSANCGLPCLAGYINTYTSAKESAISSLGELHFGGLASSIGAGLAQIQSGLSWFDSLTIIDPSVSSTTPLKFMIEMDPLGSISINGGCGNGGTLYVSACTSENAVVSSSFSFGGSSLNETICEDGQSNCVSHNFPSLQEAIVTVYPGELINIAGSLNAYGYAEGVTQGFCLGSLIVDYAPCGAYNITSTTDILFSDTVSDYILPLTPGASYTTASGVSYLPPSNLSATPEPPTFWLMATGILGMFGWVGYRRIKATA